MVGGRVSGCEDEPSRQIDGVHDLVAGSGIAFADRGFHQLKGIAGDWHLFAVV
jgi:hypothetical protein